MPGAQPTHRLSLDIGFCSSTLPSRCVSPRHTAATLVLNKAWKPPRQNRGLAAETLVTKHCCGAMDACWFFLSSLLSPSAPAAETELNSFKFLPFHLVFNFWVSFATRLHYQSLQKVPIRCLYPRARRLRIIPRGEQEWDALANPSGSHHLHHCCKPRAEAGATLLAKTPLKFSYHIAHRRSKSMLVS